MIIIMGAVGSGKSEQTKILAERLNCPRVSTSQLLRDHPTPDRIAKMTAGELVDDHEVIELLDEAFRKIGADHVEFLMDGSPRSITQAQWMLKQINSGALMLTAIIKLNVSKEVVLERLSKRGRDDDKEAVITKRLATYEAITQPVVDYFRQHGIDVHEVDGEKSVSEVSEQIRAILDTK